MDMLDAFQGRKAVLAYLDGDFEIVEPGAYVECAVTGRRIALDELKYWSVDRQEPYADAAAANRAMVGDAKSEDA